jgi:hypothetical protein
MVVKWSHPVNPVHPVSLLPFLEMILLHRTSWADVLIFEFRQRA